jgi:acetyl-CoA carboxylase carboxyl transferase subunit alpha
LGGAHTDAKATAASLQTVLLKHLTQLLAMFVEDRLKRRYEKFRAFGHFNENKPEAAAKNGA